MGRGFNSIKKSGKKKTPFLFATPLPLVFVRLMGGSTSGNKQMEGYLNFVQ
ncbi:hypothetical protein JCM10512_2003 [Bacteroides reticulotermitis JCM 10512]|uniref:Uncharacterized protein n=1 Tax=Bacteroides reticulotermitis JCM 10512 TaxID=1445607 RepID=W4UR84_9BACE|nr:hypothetical protein JCM10512_2003 [Bacteroides reticulotermitis JCM 10512]